MMRNDLNITFLAVSRDTVSMLNDLACRFLFHGVDPMCCVATAENGATCLWYGQRIMITHNFNKETGVVNGKMAKVLDFDRNVLPVKPMDGHITTISQRVIEGRLHFQSSVGTP